MKTLIVIPTYNEEESIIKTINSLKLFQKKSKYSVDYIVINDGSEDNTQKILEQANINYLKHFINKGVGVAIKTGIKYAFDNDYDYIVQFDADGQHNTEFIDDLIEKMNLGYDIVIGSRFLGIRKPWSMRMFGSKILSNLIYLKTKRKQMITDPTSGMRIMNTKVMNEYLKDAAASEPAFVVKYINKGFKIDEIKVTMNEREAGESYFNTINSIYYMLEQILAILFGY